MSRNATMTTENAEAMAIRVLSWLLSNPELLPTFLGTTGASESDLRQRLSDAEFLASVLDFLTSDDSWLKKCCDALELEYEAPMNARRLLPGGAPVHWT